VGAAGDSGGGGRGSRSDIAAGRACSTEEELGQPAVGDQQDLVEVVDADDPKTRKPPRLCQPRNPRSLRLTSTVFDYVGYELGSLLDARQKQPSTESYGGNIQTGQILGLIKTTYECQCHGRLANYTLKTWLYKQKWTFSEFASMRSSLHKGRKVFEYLVDAFGLDSYLDH
jgi:hypothetical protein